MAKEYKVRFKLRSDTAENWAAANPVLLEGEIGFETDTGMLKCGDGASAWSALSYNKADYAVATQESAGLMSAEDKAALDNLVEREAEAISASDIDTIFE